VQDRRQRRDEGARRRYRAGGGRTPRGGLRLAVAVVLVAGAAASPALAAGGGGPSSPGAYEYFEPLPSASAHTQAALPHRPVLSATARAPSNGELRVLAPLAAAVALVVALAVGARRRLGAF